MIVLLFRLLSFLPLWLLHAIGKASGWLTYALSPAYRKQLTENITLAGYGEHRSRVIGEIGKSVFELPFVWFASPKRVLSKVKADQWSLVEEAINDKNGVIFLTPHIGCFEITAQLVAQYAPVTVLYRPPRKPYLKPLVEGGRSRHNLSLAPTDLSGVRKLMKALRRGEIIGLLPDQVPHQGEGVWADFFGKEAYTMTLPAKLHALSHSRILLVYGERLSFGRGYVAHFRTFNEVLTDDPKQQAEAINLAMEKLIAEHPEQYLWSYNRYKTPKVTQHPTNQAQ